MDIRGSKRAVWGLFILCAVLLAGLAEAWAWAPGERIGQDLDWVPLKDMKAIQPKETPEKAGEVWVEPVTGMEMVWIPAGCFQMGTLETEKGRYEDESPVHQVCVDGFWVGAREVSNAQFRMFRPDHTSKDYSGMDLNGDSQPVVYVSWNDAMDFCKWLSRSSGGKYTFWLPTEAEWEYAARAGTTTSRFWGDDPAEACKYGNVADEEAKKLWPKWEVHPCNDGYAVTSPVGSYLPNPWGLYDVLGNAWEWCQDWRDPYPDDPGPVKNPTGPSTSKKGRIVRGGSWDNSPPGVRTGNRSYGTQNFKRYNDGFRIVRLR